MRIARALFVLMFFAGTFPYPQAHAKFQRWGPDTAWEELLTIPYLAFRPREDLGGIHFTNACLTRNSIRSLKPVPVCTKLHDGARNLL